MAKKSMKKMNTGGTPRPATSSQISSFLKNPRAFSVMKKGGSVGKQNYDETSAANNAKTVSAVPKKSMITKVGMMKKGGSVGKTPMTPTEKKFAALAAPKNKITFADKIAGSKKTSKNK